MSQCKVCENNYKLPYDCKPACNCMCENYSDFKPITRFDWIKSMDCAKLSEYIAGIYWDGWNDNDKTMHDTMSDSEKVMHWLQEPMTEAWVK